MSLVVCQELKLKEITQKEIWENFLLNQKEKTFLDSWNWGEFQKMMGEKIWRLGVFDKKRLIAVSLVIKTKAKRGTFLFCPHGSVGQDFKFEVLSSLVSHLKTLAQKEKTQTAI